MIVSKQQVIEYGLEFLRGVGTEAICEVCIPNGGSCCKSCNFLKDREGCQVRNTSCTAWLCGFQKFILFEIGFLDKWEAFWDQIPGQAYREDFTPDHVIIKDWMEIPDNRVLCNAFARDLHEIRHLKNVNINQHNDKLFTYMDKLSLYRDTELLRYVLKKTKAHMKDFKQFNVQKEIYFMDKCNANS